MHRTTTSRQKTTLEAQPQPFHRIRGMTMTMAGGGGTQDLEHICIFSYICYIYVTLHRSFKHTEKRRKNVTQNDNRTITETIRF